MMRRLRRVALWAGAAVLLVARNGDRGRRRPGLGRGVPSLPDRDGRLAVDGPDCGDPDPARRPGVPHIFAETTSDGYFALGFVHAQDRLWQMDFLRRLAPGRLSEVLGETTVDIDRFFRLLGLARLAREQVAAMPDPVKRALASYADGVNAALAAGPACCRRNSSPWATVRALAAHRLGPVGPVHGHAACRPATGARSCCGPGCLEHVSADQVDAALGARAGDQPISLAGLAAGAAALYAAIPEAAVSHSASNAWVLAGGRTASGSRSSPTTRIWASMRPALWYLARIVTPTWQVTGATVPGVPFHLLGHNGQVAWGMTTTHADTEDLVVETVDPDDAGRYLTEAGPRAFDRRTERIDVKDAESRTFEVRATRNGPVISDVLDRTLGEGSVLALASTNLDREDLSAAALYGMNHATDAGASPRSARLLGRRCRTSCSRTRPAASA